MSEDDHLKTREQLTRELDATEAQWAREGRRQERRKRGRWLSAFVLLGVGVTAAVFGLIWDSVAYEMEWYGLARANLCFGVVAIVGLVGGVRALIRAVIGSVLD